MHIDINFKGFELVAMRNSLFSDEGIGFESMELIIEIVTGLVIRYLRNNVPTCIDQYSSYGTGSDSL